MGRPGRIFQPQAKGVPAAFPPLRSLEHPGLLHNLPAQVSSFIGREAELAAVRALLAGSRLVTLTGAGGAGKTRLGLRVATELLDGTGDGVWFTIIKPISAGDPSNGADDRITAQDHRKGRPRRSRLRFARKARSPLTVILPGKTVGTYQVGRGSAVAPATRAKRAIVARAA